jgi:DNA-binding CsgD family transcriptional regulator
MPSDEVLFQLDRERGNLTGGRKRHRVSNQDLYLLQQRLAGHTYRSIGEELGMSPKAVRHRILRIKVGLKWYLAVDLDVPALFN